MANLIAVCQMTATNDKQRNMQVCEELISKAAARQAKLVFLPEGCDYIAQNREESLQLTEDMEGPTVSQYKALALKYGVWLSLGGIHIKPKGESRGFVVHLVVDSSGQIASIYHKLHLFDVDIPGRLTLRESDNNCPGSVIIPPVPTPAGRLGLAVCFDLRFPELSLALSALGAEMLSFPSAFTFHTGCAHWEVLLRSRAIENQCYVVAAAQCGQHNAKRTSYGHALVVDPWGTVIADCGSTGTGIAVVEINLDEVHRIRTEMPLKRRFDLFGARPPALVDPSTVKEFPFGQPENLVSGEMLFACTAMSLAFVNRAPKVPGHVLVATRRVVKYLADLTPSETADLFLLVQHIAPVVQRQFGGTSLTISVQDGVAAGQTVPHVHVHVLPRREGDFAVNDQVYKELEMDSNRWRTVEEMKEEASQLRKLFDVTKT